MKRLTPPLLTIGLSLLLALMSAALTYSAPSNAQRDTTSGAFFSQEAPTTQSEDQSVIGSTDEITLMSGVIAVIIVVPILISRKSWH